MTAPFPNSMRYNAAPTGLHSRAQGVRIRKVSVDAGFTCPVRDGTLATDGCAFCDNSAFKPVYADRTESIYRQLDAGIAFHESRHKGGKTAYLAYFQPFSNTYAPLPVIKDIYNQALSHPKVVGIVIGTRPDCVDTEKLDYLAAIARGEAEILPHGWARDGFASPYVRIEFGIESCYDSTLERIGRGHDFECSRLAVEMSASRSIPTGAHIILGLPSETRQMLLDECSVLNNLQLDSIKFHQLQLFRGTRMAEDATVHPWDYPDWSVEEYIDLLVDILERLRPDIAVERIGARVPPHYLASRPWGPIPGGALERMLASRLEERDTYQGRLVVR